MIRSSGFFLFGKNKFRVPVFFKKPECFPNQILVKFCDWANSELDNSKKPSPAYQGSESKQTSAAVDIFKSLKKSAYGKTQDDLLRKLVSDKNVHSVSDILKVLKLFAKTNSRDVYALRILCDAIVYKIKNEVLLTTGECCDILFSLSKLTFLHKELMEKSLEMFKNNYELESNAEIKSITRSMASLRLRDVEALDLLLKAALSKSEPTVALNTLLALGVLNYSPPAVEELIKSLVSLKDFDFKTTQEYINFIWACVLLDKHSLLQDYHLPHILSEGFNGTLSYGGTLLSFASKLKVWNINAAATQLQSYKGPLLVKDSYLDYIFSISKSDSNKLIMPVSDALSHVVAKKGKLNVNVDTGAGFLLDIECLMNTKSPKKGSSKIGVMIMNFKDICSDGESTGLFAFKLRILKGLQYHTVVVPYHEFTINSKLSEKIFYLQNKIEACTQKSSVQNEKAQNNV